MSTVTQMRNRRISLVALVVFISCTGGESSPARRTLIDSRDTYDPRSLDPALSTDVPTGRAVAYVFDGLVRFTPDAQIVPGLAREWTVSNDGLTYTFHLRSGVKFQDGRPFVARQVISSFMRALDPATKGGRGWPLYPIAGAKDYADGKAKQVAGLSAPNDSTVIIRLTEPFAIFPKLLAMPVASIVPDSVPSNFGEHPIGTGPWKFVEWKHDDYLLFAKNPTYWGTAPKADSLRARIIPEPSTAVAEFESGNVDVLYVPEAETRNWEDTDDKKAMLESAPALRMLYVAINTTRGPLADPRVRQAMNYAVDSRAILNSIMSGRGNIATGVIPPSLAGGDSTRKGYTHDVAKAKQLLAAAGKSGGIDVELWSSQTAPFPRIAQAIQANLAEAGFRVKLVQRDASSMREAARAGQTDMALKDWFADYPDGEDFLYPLLHSTNKGVGGNVSFYNNPKFDQLVSAARRELDDGKRVEMYKQADQMAYDDAPMIYLFFYKELYAVQPWITGFKVPSIFTGQNWTDVSMKRQP
ncbi:MAG TPA: ABC transporter substrate-binding protein [Gemmatimonadaceae bacterium]|nr:ABC transporter substrate-binding protein [Gemmatimonadaceae bacterium]